jgi:hypothetical protein
MIDLQSKLSVCNSFLFPLQHSLARREVLWGRFLLILLPGIGWLLNMGHRIQMVHPMQRGEPCWPAWKHYPQLLKHGLWTFLGMLIYYAPGVALLFAGLQWSMPGFVVISIPLIAMATIAIPGYMTHYCVAFEALEIYNPKKVLRRVGEGRRNYWQAWGITLCALTLSFSGLLCFGIGFLITSVWFWQVAGFTFVTVFSQKFQLSRSIS